MGPGLESPSFDVGLCAPTERRWIESIGSGVLLDRTTRLSTTRPEHGNPIVPGSRLAPGDPLPSSRTGAGRLDPTRDAADGVLTGASEAFGDRAVDPAVTLSEPFQKSPRHVGKRR